MNIYKFINIPSQKRAILSICMLFFMYQGIAQQGVENVYDSVMQLPISAKEKINVFNSKILNQQYANKEAHADVCYLVVKNLCFKKDKKSAIPFLKKELALRKKYVNSNKDLIARTYYNLGLFYSFQEDNTNVLIYSDSLLSYVPEKGKRCGKAYGVIANVYKKIGDYQRALDFYKQAEVVLSKINAKRALLTVYINQLDLYVNQGIGVSREDFEILHTKLIQLANETNAADDKLFKNSLNAGAMLYHYKEYEQATKNYDKALILAENLKDSLAMAKVYTNKALIETKKGNVAEALLINDKALQFVGNNKDQRSTIYDNIGDIYKYMKQHKKGFVYYNKAINELLPFQWNTEERLPTYEQIINSPHTKTIAGYLMDKQNAWLDFYEYTKNEKHLLAAERNLLLVDKIIDYLYFESKEKISKLFWRKKGAKLYLNAVKICFLLNKPKEAFYYIEKNKGVLLLNNVSKLKAKQIAKLPQEAINKEFVLHQKIKSLAEQVTYNTANDSIRTLYFNAKQAYYAYIKTIEKKHPLYQRFRNSLPILSSDEIKHELAENELVIAYILGQEEGYVLLMNSQEVQMFPLQYENDLTFKLNAFKNLYAKPFETQKDKKVYQKVGYELYQELLPFAEDSIFQKATKITVITDGILNSLPLEILPTSSTQNLQEAYLIQHKEISYQYSYSLAAQNDRNSNQSTAKSSAFMLTKFQDASLTNLTVKPSELFQKTTHVNEKATKENFLKTYNTSSEIYVSSHAGQTNAVPWLAMYDEKIYPDDLYFLNNPKELVVLNACKTATGTFKEGEGVFSLTRAFLNSGSKSIVATMWNLNEKSGMEILTNFKANLNKSQSKSTALRNAKLTYLAKHKNTSESSPYYWGGITLTGNTTALPKSFSYWWLISVGMIIVIYVLWRQKKKHKNVANDL